MERRFVDEQASVQYDHWTGTAALDLPDDPDTLERTLGLDPAKWEIVGLEISGGRVGVGPLTSGVTAYVVETETADTSEDIAAHGVLEVRQVEIDEEGASLRLFEDLFKRWHITLLPAGFRQEGVRLQIVDD